MSDKLSPLVGRWKEDLADGHRTWFLAGLHNDGRVWGYIHVRTSDHDKNISFSGLLEFADLKLIYSYLEDVPPVDEPENRPSLDSFIGVGTRSKFLYLLGTQGESSFPAIANGVEIMRKITSKLQLLIAPILPPK